MLQKSIKSILLRNKERIIYRWKNLARQLRGYFIDLKALLLIPRSRRFLNDIFNRKKNILSIGIFRQGGFGDRIILGSFATAVKRRFPKCRITAIVNNSVDPLRGHPAIDEIRLHKPVHWNKVVKGNQQRYDIFFELRYVPKIFVNNATLNGYKREVDNIFKKYSYEYQNSMDSSIPRSFNKLNKNTIDFLCECACLKGGQRDLFIRISERDRKILESIPFDKYITINNGAFRGRETKCWPTDNWVELVKNIRDIGLSIVQLGIETDEYVDGCYDLRGRTTIYEAAGVIERGLLHIDTEGGMVAIAKAVGRRSIVLFGPTYPEFFGLEPNINIRTKEDMCEPCCYLPRWRWTCPRGYESCRAMETITPAEVFQEFVKACKIDSCTFRS